MILSHNVIFLFIKGHSESFKSNMLLSHSVIILFIKGHSESFKPNMLLVITLSFYSSKP